MKKIIGASILALTAGVSSAQVAINGVVGYEVSHSNGVTTQGMHDSAVYFTATEKIDGLTVTASIGVNGAERGSTVVGEDAVIAVSGGFGTVKAGEVEVGNGLKAHTFGMVPVIGADGTVLGGKANYQMLNYTSPEIIGVKSSLTAVQSLPGTGTNLHIIGATFDKGLISAKADYTEKTERVRLSGSVDMKFVKVGAGWSGNEKTPLGAEVKDSWVVAAAVPMGPLTLGAAYSDGNGTATEVGASYALTKRTSVSAAWQEIKDNTTAANNAKTYRVRLTHAF